MAVCLSGPWSPPALWLHFALLLPSPAWAGCGMGVGVPDICHHRFHAAYLSDEATCSRVSSGVPGRPSLQVSGHSLPWGHDLEAARVMAARVSESPDKGPPGRGPCAQRHTPHQPGVRAPREPPPGPAR